MKGIELTSSQIKAYENGATMFMFPIVSLNRKGEDISINEIRKDKKEKHTQVSFYYNNGSFFKAKGELHPHCYITHIENIINENAPIQKGDKDIYVKEEFFWIEQTKESIFKDMFLNGKITLNETYDIKDFNWQPASQMTKEQSRYSFSECIDVRFVRVQDIEGNANIYNKLTIKWHTPKSFEGRCKNMKLALSDFFNQQLKEKCINRTYDDNDYVFLVEFKR